jgi:hypothetical protein
MRFVLLREDAADALASAAALHAVLLPVGAALAWRELAPQSCFVIALPPR